MNLLKGIDVSKWQGEIDWENVKPEIDFAIIRAGFGKGIIDTTLKANANGCKQLKIPFGLYWFSYALDTDMAKDEADFVCDLADDYCPNLPIFFDYEDDSVNFALKNGKNPTNDDRRAIAEAFLRRVKERGFNPGLYVNLSQYQAYVHKIPYKLKGYALWLAEWYKTEPTIPCDFWQYSSHGKVNGIVGDVDLNYCYINFGYKNPDNSSDLESIKDELWTNYLTVANDAIAGKFGNGMRRIALLTEGGYNPEIVQKIVNALMK